MNEMDVWFKWAYPLMWVIFYLIFIVTVYGAIISLIK